MDILIRSALVQDSQPPLDIGIREGVIYTVRHTGRGDSRDRHPQKETGIQRRP